MSDLIRALERSALTQEPPTRGYTLRAIQRIEELEHRMSEKDFLPVLKAQAEIIEEQRQRIEELEGGK